MDQILIVNIEGDGVILAQAKHVIHFVVLAVYQVGERMQTDRHHRHRRRHNLRPAMISTGKGGWLT